VLTVLRRGDAIRVALDRMTNREVIVFANGYISREACRHRDSDRHFYMLGSMGQAAAIGLGIALARPSAPVVVFDGDGNLLMGLGVMPMVGAWQPPRYLHLVLDNGTYGSTGSQPTVSASTDLPAVARACGYVRATSVETEDGLVREVGSWRQVDGPMLIHVRVSPEEVVPAPRVPHGPHVIATRVSAAIESLGDSRG
jgi:thiamine pyrophosphate-dependent acetolactate synthase large subunit-like protein